MKSDNKLVIKLVKSKIGRKPKHVAILQALGLRKTGDVVELYDTPTIRGMVTKVNYMLEVN